DLLADDTILRISLPALEVPAPSRLSLPEQMPVGTADLTAAFALADDPGTLIELPLEYEPGRGEWATAHVDLAEHAGRTITTLGLGLHTDEARELQVNLGGLTVAP